MEPTFWVGRLGHRMGILQTLRAFVAIAAGRRVDGVGTDRDLERGTETGNPKR
jgi:hypothetical protein